MGATINTIAETITPEVLWGQVGQVMPFVLGIVTFAFGYRLVKRLLSGAPKAKVKM